MPFPPPGDLPDPGIKPSLPVSPALQVQLRQLGSLYIWCATETAVCINSLNLLSHCSVLYVLEKKNPLLFLLHKVLLSFLVYFLFHMNCRIHLLIL